VKVSGVQGGRGMVGVIATMSEDPKRREHLKGPMLPKWSMVKGRSTTLVASRAEACATQNLALALTL
jgi:hypothetical protein